MDLKRMGRGYEDVEWIYLAQKWAFCFVLVTTELKLLVPRKEMRSRIPQAVYWKTEGSRLDSREQQKLSLGPGPHPMVPPTIIPKKVVGE
jgi:hypothetical protein